MSSTIDQTTASPTQDGQPIIYSQATHSAFFQGKNLGLFSGEKTYGEGPFTRVGYMGVITNDPDLHKSRQLSRIIRLFSDKHSVSGQSGSEVAAKWAQEKSAIDEQFKVVSSRIQDFLSQNRFGPVSLWVFDSANADQLLGDENSKVYVLTTAPPPSDHIPFQDRASTEASDTASISPFENPSAHASPTRVRRRARGPRDGGYPDVKIRDDVDAAGWPMD